MFFPLRKALFGAAVLLGAAATSTMGGCSDDDYGQEAITHDLSATVTDGGGDSAVPASTPDQSIPPDQSILPDLSIVVDQTPASG